MSDDAPAPAGGAPAAGLGGGHGGGGGGGIQIDQPNGVHEGLKERKPVVTKSAFDTHVSDLANPLHRTLSKDSSKDLEDYFVRFPRTLEARSQYTFVPEGIPAD